MAKTKTIRILLADDHLVVRSGLRSLLERVPGFTVVAQAADGNEAIALVGKHRPDVALMDIAMPGMSGVEAARRIAAEFPGTRILILSVHAGEEYVLQSLQAGAAGYLMKDADLDELRRAVCAVAGGESYLSPALSAAIADYVRRTSAPTPPTVELSPRRTEVLRRIAAGRTTKQIALELKLSVKTIESHRAALMRQLDIHDVAGLVRYAIRAGLVGPEE
jgi:DNA-binding NarL/FixJ family response regulator